MVPAPAEGVEVIVGGVAVVAYVEVYDPESMTCVLAVRVTVKLIVLALATAYVASAPIEEPIVHVPAVTNATTPVEELIVHTGVVELE